MTAEAPAASLPEAHRLALGTILASLEGAPVEWALTGSTGMVLQGMPVEPHDIDIQTDPQGAYRIEERLAAHVVKPVRCVESERMRSHLGVFEVNGVQVEVMGGIQKRLDDQTWEEPVQVGQHRLWVDFEGQRVAVLSLEYECQAYLRMGRVEKAEKIRAWLNRNWTSG